MESAERYSMLPAQPRIQDRGSSTKAQNNLVTKPDEPSDELSDMEQASSQTGQQESELANLPIKEKGTKRTYAHFDDTEDLRCLEDLDFTNVDQVDGLDESIPDEYRFAAEPTDGPRELLTSALELGADLLDSIDAVRKQLDCLIGLIQERHPTAAAATDHSGLGSLRSK